LAGPGAVPGSLLPGTPAEIATGAPVPGGADSVLPYERSIRVDDTVTPDPQAPAGRRNIRVAGEDALPGDPLVPAGRRVSSAVLGAAAQAGADTLAVHRRPAVRLAVTGDEIVHGGLPAPGLVRDALGPAVAAVVAAAGGTVTSGTHLPDDGAALRAALIAGGDDVLVVTGSSSVGAADHLHRVLAGLGAEWHVDGVQCRPGHPQLLARLPGGGPWVVGLPGNPFAGLVAALTLLQPLLEALTGAAPGPAVRLPVFGSAPVPAQGVRLVPVRLETTHATIATGARPASLRAAATADALAVLDPGWTDGAPADLLPIP
ncbi:molybdopterin-binding protein, partial [Dactylosporangium salmoneum]|uniref:molybdopterin-binding protein n=1 Tax=Dactylosporangium salmoneum TaxID=53361 RepID=UPI0031E1DAE8